MITYKEYKILKLINELTKQEKLPNGRISSKIFIDNIIKNTKLKDYEIQTILYNLSKYEFIDTAHNPKTKDVYLAGITNSGLSMIKNYKRELIRHIFDKYIWVIVVSAITSFLTAYFTIMID